MNFTELFGEAFKNKDKLTHGDFTTAVRSYSGDKSVKDFML